MIASTPNSRIPIDESLITSFADNKRHACGHSPLKSGGKGIENHDALASIDQLMHHVTADIASSAGDQHRHLARTIAVSLGPTSIELNRRMIKIVLCILVNPVVAKMQFIRV
jgi:hypothetical protein